MTTKGICRGLIAGAFLLAGCAGRDANPVSTANAYDGTLSCEQISAEIYSNNDKIRQLADEKNSGRNQNIAVGVVGAILFWPALFALDFSDSEKVEMDALQERNRHLSSLMGSRSCATKSA